MTDLSFRTALRLSFLTCGILLTAQYLLGQEQKGMLSVKRIYSQPSLGGRLSRAVQWTPDEKTVSFFETSGAREDAKSNDAKSQLWALDLASGQRRLLVSAE